MCLPQLFGSLFKQPKIIIPQAPAPPAPPPPAPEIAPLDVGAPQSAQQKRLGKKRFRTGLQAIGAPSSGGGNSLGLPTIGG